MTDTKTEVLNYIKQNDGNLLSSSSLIMYGIKKPPFYLLIN